MISVIAALGLTIVPDEWVGFLGLIPLGIGIWTLVRGLRRNGDDDDDDKITAVGLWGVAGITIANGADNISLYTPIFRTSTPADVAIMIVVFLVLVAVWCVAGRLIGTHKVVTETLERVEHWLVPVVFIGLGLFILIESGVVSRLVEVIA
ncbi:cadmium resistance transporter [Nesterenkonia massiliensis]|uniref:Cadmium resistance transporter n=2 Tax=Nesterenkonia massiliensis TaxID=1232429 RepID=A0ABT2HQI1_9MICC|nr:cadmium resistance transporter [Nesterenkonia massiliensis]